MRTKEFIEKIEDLGFHIFKNRTTIEIIDVDLGTIAIVVRNVEMQMDNKFYWWDKLDDDRKESVFKLMSELAMTKIKDR